VMFRRQFEHQIGFQTALQEARLAAAKDQSLKLARSVRLISLMSEPDIEVAKLYLVGTDELRQVLASQTGEAPVPESAPAGLRATFFGFLDLHAKPLMPPKAKLQGHNLQAGESHLVQVLTGLNQSASGVDLQEIGYIASSSRSTKPAASPDERSLGEAGPGGSSTLNEAIVTRVIDPVDGRAL